MPDFSRRTQADEMMDDFSITDGRLTHALSDLRWVNRWLGGHRATDFVLAPLLRQSGSLRIIDLGSGGADYPEHLVRWADRQGHRVDVVAVDANPQTVSYAQSALDDRLPAALRNRVEVACADALDLPYDDDAFDVAMGALFLHHFHGDAAVALLREMDRVARHGIIVNDLHRHPVAYYGVHALGTVMGASKMFRHDGPLSILRGFTRGELERLAQQAGFHDATLHWRWAFRWVLTTLSAGSSVPMDSAETSAA